ncbi:MAG: hypothetical protein KC636_32410 [Myxococcales bacterium]|nr:hypothetical protein [Myxococcales bacterium]
MSAFDAVPSDMRGQVGDLATRWRGFVQKVERRVEAVRDEASAGLDALIALHADDAGPMGAAFSAVQSRFHGIRQKVDEAWTKIDEELWRLLDVDGLSPAAVDALIALRDGLAAELARVTDAIEDAYERLNTAKTADWARQLKALADVQAAGPFQCSQCGGPLTVTVTWAASNVTCPHCKAVNGVHPGTASSLFYGGAGVHALAHEAAYDQRRAEQRALAKLHARRHPTQGDVDAYLAAARAYWTRYYEVTHALHPGFAQPLEEAVAARLKHYAAWEQEVERQKRRFFGELAAAAEAGQTDRVAALVRDGRPHHVGVDECAECLVERGLLAGAHAALAVQHQLDDEDAPLPAYVAERLADIRRTLG